MIEFVDWLRSIHSARQIVGSIPEGGLGFHGTTTLHRISIIENGLDPSRARPSQRNIFYYCFDPANLSVFNPRLNKHSIALHLLELIQESARIAIRKSTPSSHGELPLLVIFRDPNRQGQESPGHAYPTRLIPMVPTQDFLGTYTLVAPIEYKYDGSKPTTISSRFIRGMVEDLAKKLR